MWFYYQTFNGLAATKSLVGGFGPLPESGTTPVFFHSPLGFFTFTAVKNVILYRLVQRDVVVQNPLLL